MQSTVFSGPLGSQASVERQCAESTFPSAVSEAQQGKPLQSSPKQAIVVLPGGQVAMHVGTFAGGVTQQLVEHTSPPHRMRWPEPPLPGDAAGAGASACRSRVSAARAGEARAAARVTVTARTGAASVPAAATDDENETSGAERANASDHVNLHQKSLSRQSGRGEIRACHFGGGVWGNGCFSGGSSGTRSAVRSWPPWWIRMRGACLAAAGSWDSSKRKRARISGMA